jgi:hypothetical protein
MPPWNDPAFRLNRTKRCNCCKVSLIRDQVLVKHGNDAHYAIAICPTCDKVPPKKAVEAKEHTPDE